MELSRANPSAGWVAGVIGVHPWQLALFDERAGGDVGRRPDHHALVVVQPDRHGGVGRGRLPRVRPLVVLVGLRPLPRRNLGAVVRDSAEPAGSPTSGRSCCCAGSTASTTTGTSPDCGPPAARTSWSTRSFVPDHRTQSHTTTRWARRCRARSATTARSTGCRGRWCSTWRSRRRCSVPRRASSRHGSTRPAIE